MTSVAAALPVLAPLPSAVRARIDQAFVNGGELWIGVEFDTFRADDLCFYEAVCQLRSRIERIEPRFLPVGPVPRDQTLDWKWCNGRLVMPVLDSNGHSWTK